MTKAEARRTAAPPKPEFLLYTRSNCGLCVEMRAALHAAAAGRDYACLLIDVDADPALTAEFGARVPVLAAGGAVLCEGRFDPHAVAVYLERDRASR